MPVYYEFRKAGDELLVTYWFSYGHSAPHTGGAVGAALGDKLSHEGDWENVDVALALERLGAEGRVLLRARRTDAPHLGAARAERRPPGRLQRARLTRLLLRGRHYQGLRRPRASNDIRDQGFRWDTWKGADSLRPARDEPWFTRRCVGGGEGAQGRPVPRAVEWKLRRGSSQPSCAREVPLANRPKGSAVPPHQVNPQREVEAMNARAKLAIGGARSPRSESPGRWPSARAPRLRARG